MLKLHTKVLKGSIKTIELVQKQCKNHEIMEKLQLF
jgi:hypothetical protein